VVIPRRRTRGHVRLRASSLLQRRRHPRKDPFAASGLFVVVAEDEATRRGASDVRVTVDDRRRIYAGCLLVGVQILRSLSLLSQ